jgi:hypothetical protein
MKTKFFFSIVSETILALLSNTFSEHNFYFRDLSFNKLSGPIPNTLGGLKNTNLL